MLEERDRANDDRADKGPAGSEDAHLFLGLTNARGGYRVSPQLQEWIASELQKESAVLKECRKAREERQLARKPARDDGK